VADDAAAFDRFVGEVEPRLRQALVGLCGPDRAGEAVQEALVRAWQDWSRVQAMRNPAGYLYRVARSRIEWPRRRQAVLPEVPSGRLPEVEPRLPRALGRLSERQRMAVWLVTGCDWRLEDTAELMGVSMSSVRRHLDRGLGRLRSQLGVNVNA
jgi:DNA-directed RNA polymerase specialized sigma24 family protein